MAGKQRESENLGVLMIDFSPVVREGLQGQYSATPQTHPVWQLTKRRSVHHIVGYPTGKLREEMFAAFRAIFKGKTQAEWLKILNDNDNQFGPVNETPDEVANDPHNKARQSVIELPDPVSKEKVKYLGFILKFAENPGTLRFGPNLMGAETVQILDELGYKEADIRHLKDTGVIDLP